MTEATTNGPLPDQSLAAQLLKDLSSSERTDPTGTAQIPAAAVKGQIKVADEVVEKVAALAALECGGVADMGGDLARAFESVRDRIGIGSRRVNQGVSADIQDKQVAVSLTIVVEYGHVVMEVAAEVKTNVARTVSRMLGLRVSEVNVTVDDVRLPGEPRPRARREPEPASEPEPFDV
ncbi:Asp23/Gls24 family envelope stress response protein [Nonomuraea sp. NBC_01738]|uniref:Asp23/Gls24 family envelope stress response protein n=1 Tax=Nonomuraea sp. NBC_01738 TaxID=2976003 RepID=UPI002E1276F7|nr:Asp23/Gls24 family envelope stress response protein [Nonomuraea sp. NBC_01738]